MTFLKPFPFGGGLERGFKESCWVKAQHDFFIYFNENGLGNLKEGKFINALPHFK
ncbi:hypothetical protein ACCE111639_12110 [Acinetobacter celticus]